MELELFARQLAWPTDWTAVYGREAPLLMEIGFGGGHFLRDLARTRPWANVLGVEISLPAIRRGLQKLRVANLTNGRVVQSVALYVLWAACAPASVAEVYINFPDPWPKHTHRRLINGVFLDLVATRLLPGGRLEIATDHADYARAISACLAEAAYLESALPTPFVTQDSARLRTKYEQIALADGRVCTYFKWRRKQGPISPLFPVPEEVPMPHLVLHSPLSPAEIMAQFTPQHYAEADTHIKCSLLFQAQDGHSLLVEAYVAEEPLAQRVGITLRQRQPGEYVIGLSDIGFPRPTAGLQLAIRRLADWVCSLHPQTTIIHHNLGQESG